MEETNVISFTKVKLPYGWLGNMAPYPVDYEGKTYKTTEHLFQCLRFSDAGIRALIMREASPMAAKMVAKANKEKMTVVPLSSEDVQNMALCVKLKVEQHPELKPQLLEIEGKAIIEDVTARGAGGTNLFWGALFAHDEWFGHNTLGLIWMDLARDLRWDKEIQSESEGNSAIYLDGSGLLDN